MGKVFYADLWGLRKGKYRYQKIVVALKETTRLMEEIDELIPSWPIE